MSAPYAGAVVARLGDIQLALREAQLEGWLLTDHRRKSPLALRALGLADVSPMRRFFFWISADGMPALVAHALEADAFGELPGDVLPFHDWTTLRGRLEKLLPPRGRIAMEHQPIGGSPDLSCVDGGTVALVESYGPKVVTSADLANRFLGPWRKSDQESHARASKGLDAALAQLVDALGSEKGITERALRTIATRALSELSLDAPAPWIASGVHTRERRARTDRDPDRAVGKGDIVTVEITARERATGSPYAHRSHVLSLGQPSAALERAFEASRAACDAAVAMLRERAERGERLLGYEVADAAHRAVDHRRIGARWLHRAGHHLGWVPFSGEACTFDDLEWRDVREVLTGLAWSIHPGVYVGDHGLATSTTVRRSSSDLEILVPAQESIRIV